MLEPLIEGICTITAMSKDADDVIDLSAHVTALWKRKSLVLAIFLVSVIGIGIRDLVSPRIYRISTIIEPPVSTTVDGEIRSIDAPSNIKAKIDSGAYDVRISSELRLQPGEPRFSVALPGRDSRLVVIGLDERAEDVAIGQQVLRRLLELIDLDYAQIQNEHRNRIDNRIKTILTQIATKENELKLQRAQFVASVGGAEQQAESPEKGGPSPSAAMRRKVDFSAQLQGIVIDNFRNEIDQSRLELERLSLQKEGVRGIQIIQEPHASAQPVAPQKRTNIILGGILGLTLGVILAFALEHGQLLVGA
jgi:LPS O-antigen subunit length determinant protein (WzzB/FepE family)